MATTKPIRDLGTPVTPVGTELILIDNGVSMKTATINDAVTPKASALITANNAVYDPQGIAGDAFARANHTGTQTLSTISDAGTAAAAATTDFATAAQGALADTATQPGDLGNSAALDVGTTAGTVAAGDDSRITGAVQTSATDASSFGFVLDEDDMASDSAQKVPTQQSVNQGKLQKVATRTAMKALAGSKHLAVYLMEAGREGTFQWNSSGFSAEVTADTQEGIYIAPSSDATGASGAWVRQGGWAVAGADARWFGLVADYDPVAKTGTAAEDAINAAFAVVPWVRLPDGNILLSDMVTLDGTNEAKKLTGAGRRLTSVYVNSGFNLTADGVIKFTGGEAKHTAGHFSVVCQDQPDSATLADYVAYPAVIHAVEIPRFTLFSLRIQEAYIGIDMSGNAGGAVIDNLELSAFYRGIHIDGALDSIKIDKLHWWPFGFASVTNKRTVYEAAYGIFLGRADDFHLSNSLLFGSFEALHAFSGVGGGCFGTITGTDFDGRGGIVMTGGTLCCSSVVMTTSKTRLMSIAGGTISFASSWFLHSIDDGDAYPIDLTAGVAVFSGCFFESAPDRIMIRAANSFQLSITGSSFKRSSTGPYTKQMIDISGSAPRLIFNDNLGLPFTTGSSIMISVGPGVTGNVLGNTEDAGWSINLTNAPITVRSDIWRSYTPIVTAGSGTLTSVTSASGEYARLGDIVHFRAQATITAVGTGGTSIVFTIPIAGSGTTSVNATGSNGVVGSGFIGSGATSVTVRDYTGAFPAIDGRVMFVGGSYRVAA